MFQDIHQLSVLLLHIIHGEMRRMSARHIRNANYVVAAHIHPQILTAGYQSQRA